MTGIRINVFGDWQPSQVRTAWVPNTHQPPPDLAHAIDQAWQTAIAKPDIRLFDGPMCRLESWHSRGETIELAMSPTTYRLFWGTNIANPHFADRYGQRVLANPIGLSPALQTSDGFLLLGRRNNRVAYYPGRLHPFAGCLEPRDAGSIGAGPDPFDAVRRELKEELSLEASEVPDLRLIGIVEDANLRQPEMIFRGRTTLTRRQIETQVHRDEHLHCVAIPADRASVAQAIRNPDCTPVAAASLLLWGRAEFGEDWFAKR